MTAPMTPERLHYIKGQQVQRKIARARRVSVNPNPLILELDDALAEVDRLRAQVAALRKVATEETPHVYMGLCPDQLDGLDQRDPDCPACAALASGDESSPATVTVSAECGWPVAETSMDRTLGKWEPGQGRLRPRSESERVRFCTKRQGHTTPHVHVSTDDPEHWEHR